MDPAMTTTAFEIEGYRTVRNLGVVRGITVRSRSIFGTVGGALQTLVGGNITLFTELCEKTRSEAFEMISSTPARSAPTQSSASATTQRRSWTG